MSKKTLFVLWGVLYILCAGLGFVYEPEGALKALLVLLAVGFFVPGGMLLYRAAQEKDRFTLKLIRNLAALSLVLTVVLVSLNFMSVWGSRTLGMILNSMLVVVSSPMFCGQYWVLSMFGWAYLMIAAISELKKLKKK